MIAYRAAIIITIAVLAAAAILIFWKAGEYTRGRFVRLCAGNLLIHLADGFITYVNTPGLEREGNPLVRVLGLGWGALFLANLLVFVFLVLCAWSFCRYEHVHLEASGMFDYYMKLMHGEGYKPIWFWYKTPGNYRAMFAFGGYGLYWGLTAAAPIPVVGWIHHMLERVSSPLAFPRFYWWNSRWLSFGLAMTVCLLCMYKWTREGYRS